MTELKPVLVIGHIDDPSLAVIAWAAEANSVSLKLVRPVRGEPLPPLSDVLGIIVLGGPQSAYNEAGHAYLDDEKEYIRSAHTEEVPTLGICLGSQLAAEALGGEAYAGESGLEFGYIDVKAAEGASIDFNGRFFSFHSDSMRPPPHSTVLAVSDRYVQAWTSGSVLAIQYHPELDQDGINALLDLEGEKLASFGVDLRGCAARPRRQI